jgi:hypothetical protein
VIPAVSGLGAALPRIIPRRRSSNPLPSDGWRVGSAAGYILQKAGWCEKKKLRPDRERGKGRCKSPIQFSGSW